MTIALSGICLHPSSNKTGLSKLFVRYSAEHSLAIGLSQSSSGTEVLIQRDDRSLGSGIAYVNMIHIVLSLIY